MSKPIVLDAYKQGFKASFRYDPYKVEEIKQCLGWQWSKELGFWWAAGPEVLLDMERFAIPFVATREAQARIDDFKLRLHTIAQLKNEQIDGQFGYQAIGTNLLVTQQRAILADDMGLGKSKQALDALALVWPRLRNRRCLVVAPGTLVYNWYDPKNPETEFLKWHPELPAVNVPEGGPKKRSLFWENLLEQDEFIIVTNYEKVRMRDFPIVQFDVVICDEATRLKNSQTDTWRAIEMYTSEAKYVWALTGTPIEIRMEELFNLMKIVRPATFGNFSRFRQAHLMTDMAGSVYGISQPELLKERYGPWMTRRTKKEVAKWLPEKLPPVIYWIDMSQEEEKEYKDLVKDFESSQAGKAFKPINSLTELIRLQQWCCSPRILFPDRAPGTKFEQIKNIAYDWDGLVVIFSQYKEMTNLLVEWLEINPRAYIHGGLKQEAIRRGAEFSRGELGKILVSTDAGAYGLNITGADLIIHYDQVWNPAIHRQREDRLHRTGQTKPVNVLYACYRNTIEEGKRGVLEFRQNLAGDFVDDVEAFTKMKFSSGDFLKIARGEYRRVA